MEPTTMQQLAKRARKKLTKKINVPTTEEMYEKIQKYRFLLGLTKAEFGRFAFYELISNIEEAQVAESIKKSCEEWAAHEKEIMQEFDSAGGDRDD